MDNETNRKLERIVVAIERIADTLAPPRDVEWLSNQIVGALINEARRADEIAAWDFLDADAAEVVARVLKEKLTPPR